MNEKIQLEIEVYEFYLVQLKRKQLAGEKFHKGKTIAGLIELVNDKLKIFRKKASVNAGIKEKIMNLCPICHTNNCIHLLNSH